MNTDPPKRTELLSPAGNLKNLGYALAYGADAVYAGIPRYSLRVRNNDFHRQETLQAAITRAHEYGRAFFLACNLMPHGAKLRTFVEDVEPVMAMGPDALIMADPGLILLARERWPEMPIHLSVQANTMNAAAVRFWQRQGLRRIILSRELALDEIEDIRQACPDIELEVFVHGALCMAYSGRCLLSGYFNHRDANQGACTNACRWDYRLGGIADAGGTVRHPAADEAYLLEEGRRAGEYLPIFEDEHGTYIMNSKDLRAIEHVGRLVRMGIDSLKIEGRTKSEYYTARTTQIYRRAIDDALAGQAFRTEYWAELDKLANRGYTDGFYQRHSSADLHNYAQSASTNADYLYVGEALPDPAHSMVTIEVKNRFAVGDALEWITPAGNHEFQLTELFNLDDQPVLVAPGSGHRVRLSVPGGPALYGLLVRREQRTHHATPA